MQTDSSTPPSLFHRMRPGIIAGLIIGPLLSISGSMIYATISLFNVNIGSVNGLNFYYMYPLLCLWGFCGGFILGPVGGLLGAFVAVKTSHENRIRVYGILGSVLLSILFVLLSE